jgi:folate-binding protein YgfZ
MEDCSVDDTAEQDASLLVWGPTATEALQKVVGAAPAAPAEHHGVALGQFNGESVTLVTSAAPGAGGSEIIVPAAAAGELFDQLVAAGLQPVGETAYEQARIEAGIPAMGKDLGEHCNPLEAGLQGSVSFSKGCYLGQEVVARLNSYAKIRRHLKGVKFPASASPDSLGDLFTELLRIGNVTSATHSPRLNATVALAFLKSGYEQTGRTLEAVVEGETIEGVVCETPFEA